MLASQHSSSLMLITLVIMAIAVVFWRTVIKLVAIGALTLLAVGFIEILRGLH